MTGKTNEKSINHYRHDSMHHCRVRAALLLPGRGGVSAPADRRSVRGKVNQ